MKSILIGIQARSTSTRLPNKVHMQLGGIPILKRVIDSCQSGARFINMDKGENRLNASVAVLVPKDDKIAEIYRKDALIIEGDENDVLSRFVDAQRKLEADFVMRVTADCPFMPPHIISKLAKAAKDRNMDYTTNVHIRTFREGWDCEILSARLLDWLDANARDEYDREHVTTLIGHGKPFPFKQYDGRPSICHVVNFPNESEIKTSIDTFDEYQAAEQQCQEYSKVIREASRYGVVRI